MVCVGCNVARYCGKAHQKQAWKNNGRVCHKMCPLLKQWRRVKKGKDTAESCDGLFKDFFESMHVVASPTEAHSDVVQANDQHASENGQESFECDGSVS